MIRRGQMASELKNKWQIKEHQKIWVYNDDQISVLFACCAVNNFNEQFTLSMQSSPWATQLTSGCMTLSIASNPKPRGCTHQHFLVHHFYFSIDTIMRVPWNHFLSLRIHLHNTHNIFTISLIFTQLEHQQQQEQLLRRHVQSCTSQSHIDEVSKTWVAEWPGQARQ